MARTAEQEQQLLDEQARHHRPRALVIDEGDAAVLPADLAPAIAGEAARLALGQEVRFAGLNRFGQPVYRREASPAQGSQP